VIVDDGVVGKGMVRDREWREIEHGWLFCEKMENGSVLLWDIAIAVGNKLMGHAKCHENDNSEWGMKMIPFTQKIDS
jgi:hypothetical protein